MTFSAHLRLLLAQPSYKIALSYLLCLGVGCGTASGIVETDDSGEGGAGVGGSVGGSSDCQVSKEICDGLDNDCDFQVDEGCPCVDGEEQECYPSDGVTSGVGECKSGLQSCGTDGLWAECVGAVIPGDDVCNGLDDDCDGASDEDYGFENCGQGICHSTASLCVNGVEANCTPGQPDASESCNGLDDNCDGAIDETCSCDDGEQQACFSGAAAAQNTGICEDGSQSCSGGAWGSCDGETMPQKEVCDGIDNDCDGDVDEVCVCTDGETQACYTGTYKSREVGTCSDGEQTCAAGKWGACTGAVTPTDETCDGLDNDCDTAIDEGDPGGDQTCATGLQGECGAGTTTCTQGAIACEQNVAAATEMCDGKDNDCDGANDNGDPGGGGACTTGLWGICGQGTLKCDVGKLSCVQENQPTTEVCNGLDEDCDGNADNGNPGGGGMCDTGLFGVCKPGTMLCKEGALACTQNVLPKVEMCDGLDNDCNGVVDDGCNCINNATTSCYGGPANTENVGICKSGTSTCLNGQWGPCIGTSLPLAQEICNGKDDDCDGGTDEGNPNGGQVCATGGKGVCAAGTTQCQNSSLSCVQDVAAAAETCNGKDDDCDGTADEANPGGGGACATGLMGECGPGTMACAGGNLSCKQDKLAAGETCDAKDNDCDGTIDDGNPGGGLNCDTMLLGECKTGTTSCQNGNVNCLQTSFPMTEQCDGKDNDCDGGTDEGNPGGGANCTTGLLGECSPGTTNCSGGKVACAQNQQAVAEVCIDGKDNDCDGAQDEGCICAPNSTQSCYTGPMGSLGVGICKAGTRTCNAGGTAWGDCLGEVTPQTEVCYNNTNDDCDVTTPDNGVDADGDGWTTCENDCCDEMSVGCASPELVNPGAYEFVGNNVDDDCDPGTSDSLQPVACSTASKFTGVQPADVAKAMDLCQFTVINPPKAQRKWGVVDSEFTFADGSSPNAIDLANMEDFQVAVLKNYGTGGVAPKKGATMAGISNGRMRDKNDPNYVAPNFGTSFSNYGSPPAVYLADHGGQLPASASCNGNCPAGSGANDSVNVKLTVRVPTNAQSFSYHFRFFTAEYWTWSCTAYNDFYLALLTTGAGGIPADKNISFDSLNNPVSVNNGFFDVCVKQGCYLCPSGSGQLKNTGMDAFNTGGGTEWLLTSAPLVPGEDMELELMVFDVSDTAFDSLALLDNFSWLVSASSVGTIVDK